MMSQDQPIETLKSLKKELKQWEHQFQNEYGRKPEKKDIAQIPDIAKKYKLYSKLKSSGTQEEEKVDSAIVTTPGVKATIIDKKELQMNLTKMSEEEVPRKANVRSTLWSGPVATDQVGTNTNRFQQRLTQQKSVEQLEENLKSLNVQPLQALETSQTDVEIQGFFHRRMEIDAFSQEKLQSMRQSIQSLTSPVVQALPTQLIQVQSQSPSLDEKPPAAVLQKPIDLPQPDIIAVKPVAKSSWTEPPESQQTEPKEPKSERSSRSSRRYSKKDTPVIEPPSPVAVAQLPDPKQEEPETPKELESQAAVKEQEKVEETVKEQEKLDEAAKEQEEPRVSRNSPGEVNKLPSIVPGNLFARVDDGGVLRCKLYRKKNLLEVNFPTYMLHNEADNKFMFSAKKRIMSKTPNYIVSDSPGDISKDSIHYVGKIKGNFKRSNFIISDTRNPSKPQEVALVNYVRSLMIEQECVTTRIASRDASSASQGLPGLHD
ncbi:hypothetical protein EDD86DRAFT_145787 [Gorgonomyces haynaldii]|nr:hypothetical protein EDD86DRAFT_145787 [Gorgonomyces haynaldii]